MTSQADRIADEHNRLNARAHDHRLTAAERSAAAEQLREFDRKYGIELYGEHDIARAESGYADA